MNTFKPDREFALKILKEHIKNESLIRHALTMKAVMRHFAMLYFRNVCNIDKKDFEAEVEKWGIIGLLHDIDYEKYPDKHCLMTREILSSYGFPKDYIRAIESHGYKIVNDVKPMSYMEKVLYATDELTGLIAATALMRPSKSILDLSVSSVKKKWKQKSFAAGVNRDIIEKGAKMLEVDIDNLIEQTINGMKVIAEQIGL